MSEFKGISQKAINLLAENKYRDSRAFYEEHKEELKNLATVPMRQLMTELSASLLKLDDEIYVNPIYTVSRIHRDTRFSKNKMLYRENLWVMFRRHKAIYRNYPMMWFEFFPNGFNYGIAFFVDKPSSMNVFRQYLLTHQDEFRLALKETKKSKLVFNSDAYKKPKEGEVPEDLIPYYQSKNLNFVRFDSDLRKIRDDSIIIELKKMIKAVAPMYCFLQQVHSAINEEEL